MERFTQRSAALSPFILCLMLFLFPLQTRAAAPENAYVGAGQCAPCHRQVYDDWKTSGHARILLKPSSKEGKEVPLPPGLTKKDISYIIGGFRWKALFLDGNGYLVTSTPHGSGGNQYNLESRKWVDYLPGQKVPYDCGGCHTTGFSPEGHHEGREGIIGTWRLEGVQCEACHGPGALHARSALKADIRIDRNSCATCHALSPRGDIPVQGVFIAPYTETNQLLKSTMRSFSCTVCHNPHLPSKESVRQSCESCHQGIAARFKESYKGKRGITCIDCHMPPAGVVAEGNPALFRGDLKSHLFTIDHAAPFPAVVRNGRRVNPGYLGVEYACMRCHNVYESREWAVRHSMGAHRIQVSSNIRIMRFQMLFASFGVISAALALLSAASLKKWLLPAQNMKRALSIHKHAAWITFACYVFVSAMCVYFHFPLRNPSKALNLGWFLVHPLNGVLGLVLYGGKIIAVRKYKKGWARSGMVWGIGLAVFWLVQYLTVLLSFFGIGGG